MAVSWSCTFRCLEAAESEKTKNVFVKTPQSQNFKTKHFLQYGCNVDKFDRHGYKRRGRTLFLSDRHLYLTQEGEKQFKIKHKIPLEAIARLEITSERDNFLLVRIPPNLTKDKVSRQFARRVLFWIFSQNCCFSCFWFCSSTGAIFLAGSNERIF